ncbi:vesicle transport protein SEC20 [Culicoides brevitarsis]|uniref:vesicle transport protein SEC20 n=1 Tax=Culicoides brevitarsis TaxID=469753 RepID=UPI00307B1444
MFGAKHNIQKDLAELRQQIVENSLELQAVTQDILACKGPRSELEHLNECGRAKISALRKCIERLDDYSSDLSDPQIYKEVNLHRESFSKSLQAFRKANIQTMLEIEKTDRVDLLASVSKVVGGNETDGTRHRTGAGLAKKAGVVSQHESVTEKMLSISRHLSDTTQKSAATLETLVASSVSVEGTSEELQNTAGTIQQSGKLLKKYGRRECTDKILLFFAFSFFIACVIYIVQKRLF